MKPYLKHYQNTRDWTHRANPDNWYHENYQKAVNRWCGLSIYMLCAMQAVLTDSLLHLLGIAMGLALAVAGALVTYWLVRWMLHGVGWLNGERG